MILFITLVAIVVTMFALTVMLVGAAAVFGQATPGTTPSTPTSVAIAFVGNTSPRAGIDHVSVAGVTTYSNAATSSRDTEQKLITVAWGDGAISQSKITRISSSSEGKWGPFYHKYDSATAASNPYAIVAKMDILSYSSSSNNLLAQIKSEPYLINVQKGPIAVSSSDSQRNNIGLIPKNNDLTLIPLSHWVTIIALSVIGSVMACSVSMVTHRRSNQKMILTLDGYKDEKQNHYTNTSTRSK